MKLRSSEQYVRYLTTLCTRKRFVIPARSDDQCWIELKDDCEYFLPVNEDI
jgi:hypothetical protein